MPTLTQAPSQGDVVKFQIDPNYTNEAITLLLGTNYKSGSVLGKITATGKYKLAVVGAVDGSAVAVAVLLNPVDATAADATGVILARGPAVVSKAALVFDVSVNTVPLTATKAPPLAILRICQPARASCSASVKADPIGRNRRRRYRRRSPDTRARAPVRARARV